MEQGTASATPTAKTGGGSLNEAAETAAILEWSAVGRGHASLLAELDTCHAAAFIV